MKKILKAIFTFTFTVTPLLGVCSCGSKKVDSLYYELKDSMINYFMEWCKYPHPTYYFGPVNKYLTETIKDTYDIDVKRDDYYKIQAQKEWPEEYKEYYGNIWFDIPASEGYEYLPLTVLQSHMDMVIDGMSMEEAKNTPIIPVINNENQVITSEDQKTSLGADGGAGIAMILALINNQKVKHGKLRILFTADEEQGASGAKDLGMKIDGEPIDVLGDARYLINLDNEKVGDIVNSSAGTRFFWYFLTNDDEDEVVSLSDNAKSIVSLRCSGVRGGHSAVNIVKHANALKCVLDVFEKLGITNGDYSDKFQLISASTDTLVANTIPTDVTIKFATSDSNIEQKIESAINSTLAYWKDECPDDKDISITKTIETLGSQKALSDEMSKKLVKFMGWFYFGVIKFIDDSQIPESSQNIGPLTINCNQNDITKVFRFASSSRSCVNDILIEFEENNKCRSDEILGKGHYELFRKKNTLRDLMYHGFEISGTKPTISDMHGGLEISYFAEIKNELIMVSIGPTITDVHNKKETLYLDTIIPEFQALVYTLPRLR